MTSSIRTALLIVALAATVGLPATGAGAAEYADQPLNGWDLNGIVRAVAIVGDVVYVGGDFAISTSPDGSQTATRENLAAFRRSDGALLPFRADTNGSVTTIEATDSMVWVAGSFTTIDGVDRPRIAALTAGDGTVVQAFDVGVVNGAIQDLLVIDEDLYIAGAFTSINSTPRTRLAAVDKATGTLHVQPDVAVNGTIEAIAADVDRDVLYAAGSFTQFDGKPRGFTAGMKLSTHAVTGVVFADGGARGLDIDVSADGSKVYAGLGGGANQVRAWDAANGDELWHVRTDGDVRAVAWHDGIVYGGFHDGFQGNRDVKLISIDDTDGDVLGYQPEVVQPHQVRAIDVNDFALVAGGDFDAYDAVPTRRIAIVPALNPPVSTPPTTPTGLRVDARTDSSVTLAWEPSQDPEHGIAYYRVLRDGVEVGSAVGTSIIDFGLSPSTTYTYRLQAVDNSGAESGISAPLQATTAPPPGTRFVDDDGSIFEADIEWLAAEGITKGCNPPVNDRFCPDDPVTRGQMAAFLGRMFLPGAASQPSPFLDDDTSVFEADIAILAAAGITKGCNPPVNDRYCPDDPVTRGQMAAFLNRVLELPDASSPFVDDDDNVFEADIAAIAAAGVTKGCNPPSNDEFCPARAVTRGEMAAFLHRSDDYR